MLKKVRKVASAVELVLEGYPASRDDDIYLMRTIWGLFGATLLTYPQWEALEEIMREYNPESIRRVRQKLQEQGKYLGTAKVKHERYMRSLEMQQAMPAHKPRIEVDKDTNTIRMF